MEIKDSTIEEIKNASPVYYRIYENQDGKYVVVCMQWFDEYDYFQDKFLNDVEYETEEKAEEALKSAAHKFI